MNLQEIVTKRTGKAISQCSNEELYFSLLEMTKGMAEEKVSNEGKRKLYYIYMFTFINITKYDVN